MNQRLKTALGLLAVLAAIRVAVSQQAPKPADESGPSATAPGASPPSAVLATEPAVGGANTNVTEITSKQLRMDTEKKIAYFDGDVVVLDPQFLLRSNRLIVYLNRSGSGMERAEAYDDVVIVQEQEKRKAHCQKAVYTPADGRIVLTGTPDIESSNGITRGDVITIFRTNNLVLVEGQTRTTVHLGGSTESNKTSTATQTNAVPKPETK